MKRLAATLLLLIGACSPADHDVLISGGTIYDGNGGQPFVGYVLIDDDRIVAIGAGEASASADLEIDASGLAVAPGFINMLSQAHLSLREDGRAVSDLMQGVTLEVLGEGPSMGPRRPTTNLLRQVNGFIFGGDWTTLGGYLEVLEADGVSPNVASYVGATTLRSLAGAGEAPARGETLEDMRDMARRAMNEGALGVSSALIYDPALHADTAELIALAEVAAGCGGIYASHVRSEGNGLIRAIDEAVRIGEASGAPVHIHHLKAAGDANWHKLPAVIDRLETAGATANMYVYDGAETVLSTALAERAEDTDNLFLLAGSAENVMLSTTGVTLASIAGELDLSPEAAIPAIIETEGRGVRAVFRMMSETNIERQVQLPWMGFASDSPAFDPEAAEVSTHPRAYGNFARLLGTYVRDRDLLSWEEAVRRLTSLPADTLGFEKRGRLVRGNFADIAIFDPETIGSEATYTDPHRLATGVRHVFVNGVRVVADGVHTGAMPGRFVKGPGAGRCPS